MHMSGWIYIEEDGEYHVRADHFQDHVYMELGDYKIVASYWNADQQPTSANPNTWSTREVNRVGDSFLGYPNVIKLKKGFYKLNIEYIDQRTDVCHFLASQYF